MNNRLVDELSRLLTIEGIPLTSEGLITALSNSRLHVRIGAAIILGRSGEATAIPHLKTLLTDEPMVRVEAAMSLTLLKDESGIPVLIEALECDLLSGAPVTAANYLAVLGDPRGYKLILKALNSDLEGIRLTAAVALKNFLPYHGHNVNGQKIDLFTVLEKALNDPAPLVRGELVHKLAKLDDPRSTVFLSGIANRDTDEDIRLTARQFVLQFNLCTY